MLERSVVNPAALATESSLEPTYNFIALGDRLDANGIRFNTEIDPTPFETPILFGGPYSSGSIVMIAIVFRIDELDVIATDPRYVVEIRNTLGSVAFRNKQNGGLASGAAFNISMFGRNIRRSIQIPLDATKSWFWRITDLTGLTHIIEFSWSVPYTYSNIIRP